MPDALRMQQMTIQNKKHKKKTDSPLRYQTDYLMNDYFLLTKLSIRAKAFRLVIEVDSKASHIGRTTNCYQFLQIRFGTNRFWTVVR